MHYFPFNPHSSQSAAPGSPPLSRAAVSLLEQMPAELRLWYLRGRFPHLLDRIAVAWPDPLRMLALNQGLEDDGRPHRAGFPVEARRELTALRGYYFTVLHPELAPLVAPDDRR